MNELNTGVCNCTKKEPLWNRNFIVVAIGNFLLFFSFYLLLPLLPLYMRDTFDANKQMIGLVLSGYTITALMIRPFSGYIVDSSSRKKVLLIAYFIFFVFFAGYLLAWTVLVFAIIRILHGFSFGLVTVANSTVAIDVMSPSRRAEGIGYYGISNNLAMAIGPTISLYIHDCTPVFTYIFLLSLVSAGIGFLLVSTVKPPEKDRIKEVQPLSLDRFFLVKGLPEGATLFFFSFAYGILSTYLAIYGKEEIGIESGAGIFFMLMAFGLILARLLASRSLYKGLLTQNVTVGMALIVAGYTLFVLIQDPVAYYISAVIIGAGYGCMCPAYQTIFINLAPNSRRGTANSTYLTSWDLGLGVGVFLGGEVAQRFNYYTAYVMSIILCIIGILIFTAYTSSHFNRIKLR